MASTAAEETLHNNGEMNNGGRTTSEDSLSVSSSGSTLSVAEQRRQARRRRILENQGERFKKILGPSATDQDIANLVKSDIEPEIQISARPSTTSLPQTTNVTESSRFTVFSEYQDEQQPQEEEVQQPIKRLLNSSLSPARQRYLLCLFGIILPLLPTLNSSGAVSFNYFLLYFILWELTIWFIDKKIISSATTNNSTNQPQLPFLLTILPLFGVPPSVTTQLKFLYKLWNWLWIDFCCFVTAILISQIILSTILMYYL